MPLKYLRQIDAKDCGATCLRMISEFYGRKLSAQQANQICETGREGISFFALKSAAERLGLETSALRLSFDDLIKTPKPAILHWSQDHFVVLQEIGKSKVLVADPARGRLRLSKIEFLKGWVKTSDAGEETGLALFMIPTQLFYLKERKQDENIGWRQILNAVAAKRLLLFQLFLGMILTSVIQLVFPFLTQSLVDIGIKNSNLGFLTLVLLAQTFLFIARTFVEFIRTRILFYLSANINVSMLADFWAKLMQLPLSYFEVKLSGDIFQRINDHKRIESFLTGQALSTLFSVVNLFVFSFVLYSYSYLVFTIFFVSAIVYFFWVMSFLKRRKVLDQERFSMASRENGATMELIAGMQDIRLNNAENFYQLRWQKLQKSLLQLSFKSISINQLQYAGGIFINEGKSILITFLVAKLVIEGELTLGAMLAIQYVIGTLNAPIEHLIGYIQQAQDARMSLDRINEIHSIFSEERSNQTFITTLPVDKSISFNSVYFKYNADSKPVLNDINLKIKQGEFTAIVGMSGSGKSTLLKLILKFYLDYKGGITIGDIDFSKISPHVWRSKCGSVMQDGFIFNDSILNNILVGSEEVNHQHLATVCTIANVMSFIDELPLKFETKIGQDGIGLSQGQKQRILIARALYKNPDYLLLDEATNALDTKNEQTIMHQLMEYFTGKTVIVVAHRLSTIQNADHIVVLDQGKILEYGDHETLIKNKGFYFELIKAQMK